MGRLPGDRLRTVEVDAQPRLVLREDLDELAATPATQAVRLLPKYDQWVLGPRHRRRPRRSARCTA